jgi:hypothetical protein
MEEMTSVGMALSSVCRVWFGYMGLTYPVVGGGGGGEQGGGGQLTRYRYTFSLHMMIKGTFCHSGF